MRSVFFRYFFRSSLILLLSLLNLGIVLMAGASSVLSRQQEEQMNKTAREVAKYAGFFGPAYGFDTSAEAAVTTMGNITSFKVCVFRTSEPVGQIVLTSEGPFSELKGQIVPLQVVDAALAGRPIPLGPLREILGEADAAVTYPITLTINGVEQTLGIVLVTSTQTGYRSIMTSFVRIWMITLVVVLLLSFALAYFSARRFAWPVRQMAACARSFAHGDFSARAPTDRLNGGEIEELSLSFNAMAESLFNAEELRRGFIANVSHELKTPMTTIAGFLDGILDGTVPADKRDDTLRIVRDEVMRLSRMVSSMTNLTRLQTGQLDVRLRSFDIGELALRVLLGFESKINAKELSVVADVEDAEGLFVTADPDSIVQVLTNLLDNAIKFSSPGGELTLSIRSKGGKAHISVSNRGQEIPPEDIPHIFDRYYKADRSRSADRTGLGLGLFLVKSILNTHNEDIHVKSEGGLTVFTFTLSESKSRGS